MDQEAYLAVAAMLNGFQGNGNPDLTMATYEAALRDVTSQAVIEAAQRFTCGDVAGQNRTFAPSIAEFVQEARRIADLIPYRNRPRLPPPPEAPRQHFSREHRTRMGLKMSLLSAGLERRQVTRVSEANRRGLDDLKALAQEWGVPIPEELWSQRAA